MATTRPDVPNFGAELAPYLGKIPGAALPAFLSRLERAAADRYRGWAEALPEHDDVLLACAGREDRIADLIAAAYPVEPDAETTFDDILPEAVARYRALLESHPVLDQLYLQSQAELQGAAAWDGLVDTATDDQRPVLAKCAALERESSVAVTALLAALD